MFPPGIEPGTLRVWGARDNRYTTETADGRWPHTPPQSFLTLSNRPFNPNEGQP